MNIIQISNYQNSVSKRLYVTNPAVNNPVIKHNRVLADTFDVHFTGEEEIPQESIKLYEARQISGIHCPVCGVKMLSKKDFKNLVENARTIQNSGQITELLNKDKDFIPLAYRRVLNDYKRIPDYKNIGMTDFVISLRDIALSERKRLIKNFKYDAGKYSSDIPIDILPEYGEFVASLDENDSYSDIQKKIQKLIEKTNIDRTHLANFKNTHLKNISFADKYYNMLNIEHLEALDNSTASEQFVAGLFLPSRNHMQKIEKYEYHLHNPNNKILACGDCDSRFNPNRKVFFKEKTQPDLKYNVTQYLKDISFLMGANVIDLPANYLSYVCNRVNALTGQTIVFSKADYQKIYNSQSIMSRHETFMPIMQTEVDIPCAECGSVLMPHAVKLKVMKDLKNCQTPYDYAEVLKKYKKYEGIYSRKLIEIFTGIVEENPYISNDKFIERYNKCVDIYLKRGVYHVLSDYRNSRVYYTKGERKKKLNVYDLIYYRTKRYVDKKKFDDYNMGHLYSAVFDGITLSDYGIKAVSTLLRQLRIISYKHSLANPGGDNYQNNKNKVNYITYNLLMSDLATADHFVAQDRGGKGSKYNLIALCKGCNKIKSNKSVIAWYDQHPGVKKNLINQMVIIDGMSKDGYLEDYDDWAIEIAEKLYDETQGLLDYREKFKE